MPARRGDKWEGRLKIGGRVVSTRRFETKRAAVEWERRQRGALDATVRTAEGRAGTAR